MELVFIGHEIPAHLPDLIKPFQHRATGKQYTWMDVAEMAAVGEVKIRPASAEEMDAAMKHVDLIGASCAYLSQFMNSEAQ